MVVDRATDDEHHPDPEQLASQQRDAATSMWAQPRFPPSDGSVAAVICRYPKRRVRLALPEIAGEEVRKLVVHLASIEPHESIAGEEVRKLVVHLAPIEPHESIAGEEVGKLVVHLAPVQPHESRSVWGRDGVEV
jgi:hypothetical protein